MGPRRIAWLFPGQGTQTVGMGRALYDRSPAARSVLELADEAVGGGLLQRCFDGPEAELQLTVHAQPAIVAVSLAALAACREAAGGNPSGQAADVLLAAPARRGLEATYVAGHSVGEVAALIATGALPLAGGMRLVQQRGRAMHEASTDRPGTMAAILGLDVTQVEQACAAARAEVAGSYVTVATHNEPTQVAIAGDALGVAAVGQHARKLGARRVVPLAVSAAFHSEAMEPAAAVLAAAAADLPLGPPRVPVVLNTSAQATSDPGILRAELSAQVRRPVRWADTVTYLLGRGVTAFLECGPGHILSNTVRRQAPGVTTWSVADPDEATAAVIGLREDGGERGQLA